MSIRSKASRRIVLPLTVALAAATAGPGTADANLPRSETHVTIDYGPAAFSNFFAGRVKSPRDACERNRVVKVFHVDAGPDTLAGQTTSNSSGEWSIGNDIAQGRYYAKAPRKLISIKRICKTGISKTIHV